MRRIVVASGKGGVGRTTLVANLGVALAKAGKKVIVVDGSLTTPDLALLFKLEGSPYTLNDVLSGEATIADVVYRGPSGLGIIPAAITLEEIKKAKPERMSEVLRAIPEKLDFLIIDAPSSLRGETIAAMRSGQEILLVATPETISMSDVMKTRIVAEFLGIKPIGIVLNRVRHEEFELKADEIKNILDSPILAIVPEDQNVKKSLKHGKLVIESSPKSPASQSIKELAKKLLK